MAPSFIYIERCSNDDIKVLYIAVFIVKIQYSVFSKVYILLIGLNIVLEKKLLMALNLK